MDYCEKINDYIKRAIFGFDLPGLAASVYVGAGSPLACAGTDCEAVAGFADVREHIALKPEHVFHMASVSKLFVATGVLMLVERGALDLDTPVCEYLPWFRMRDARYRDINAFHLLTHTAGLPDVADYAWDAPETDGGALQRYVSGDEVREASLLWAPGEGRFRYSNIAYELLGTLIAALSDRSFEAFMDEEILRPLGMTSSSFLTYARTREGMSMDADKAGREEILRALSVDALRDAGVCAPHAKNDGNHIVRETYFPYNRAHGPSSTLTANLRDMRRFGEAHLRHGVLLRPESYEKAWKPYALVPNNGEHVGLAWFMREQRRYRLYGHEGTDDGFRASFWICPELDLQIIVASNLSGAPVKKINKQLFEMLAAPV
ncbi:MAG: beta-lactamase family protein [Clostridiales Family XIII bacterium]|jgi:CubicO group peptidase (beta-lactamase class C family)|nr:beta-lactamase family protein [Clostridiales Family XIII bacterium]